MSAWRRDREPIHVVFPFPFVEGGSIDVELEWTGPGGWVMTLREMEAIDPAAGTVKVTQLGMIDATDTMEKIMNWRLGIKDEEDEEHEEEIPDETPTP